MIPGGRVVGKTNATHINIAAGEVERLGIAPIGARTDLEPETVAEKGAATHIHRRADTLLAKCDSIGAPRGVVARVSQKINRATSQIERALPRRRGTAATTHAEPAIIYHRAAIY